MHPLDSLLNTYRTQTSTNRDKGTAFEKLIAAWFMVDPVRSQRFDRVEAWRDWAKHRGNQILTDLGIDLVGTLKDGNLVAIQCKFFEAQRSIRKDDIDSFISASAKPAFSERIIVETAEKPWSPNAEAMLRDQTIPTNRVGIRELRESSVDWSAFKATGRIGKRRPKQLRPDQKEAFSAVIAGLEEADRGKLIMACGTGKTLVGLRLAEEIAGAGGSVLLLVPSLALMSQTIREWHDNALVKEIKAFAVCSDTKVGKRRRSRVDVAELEVSDLELPATTDAAKLSAGFLEAGGNSMRAVFATYQSISVISEAQQEHGLPAFDFIICDEAHRTTGVTLAAEDESSFVKVHENSIIRGGKRLYMTATPRIYSDSAQSKARDVDATLASMDDKALYGEYLYHYGFAQAVETGILSDYRVIVLVLDESQVAAAVQRRLADKASGELTLDDATRMVGCFKALAKAGLPKSPTGKSVPMRRAIAFCRSIEGSKTLRDEFKKVVEDYIANSSDEQVGPRNFHCEVDHVDGTNNARERGDRLDWLKASAGRNECRILSNARCLTEGVDVPALDAILFMHPRKSQIDVVQAVGRVMRKVEGKEEGYVVLPVGISSDVPADQALNNNEKYRVVWQVLNALRAHDERLDAVINQGGLGQDVSDRITVVDGRSFEESAELQSVTAVVDQLPTPKGKPSPFDDRPEKDELAGPAPHQLVIDEFSRAIMAKIVEKCGSRVYWEDWARDVSDIAEAHITRIGALVSQNGTDAQAFFQDFLKEVRDDLNESVSEDDTVEMLAQHLITRPVFDALFEDHAFVERNPISKAMTEILSVIDEAGVSGEAKDLEGFYASVRRRASGITDPAARQRLIVELYDKFFRGAFPLTTQKLGIVYTPVEIVDFIIHSVEEVLQEEFGLTLGSEGVHIIDPFVGTGTFITRLLQSGLIAPEDLARKYQQEIHANEIVLLAYYIAAINIETVFHSVSGRGDYLPFQGICLTDTFALHEGDDELSDYMKENTNRRERQKATEIQVVVGNPPYSTGQRSENDNAKNVEYPRLDQRIRGTYGNRSVAGNVNELYNSYIRAIRWGSDRIGQAGVMALVSGSAWIERGFADGMRKCLADEFSSIHVFHLRGDVRKDFMSGGRAGEGENVFGQKSMNGVAISVFVKNPDADTDRILFHDIGSRLGRNQKLELIKGFQSAAGVSVANQWTEIAPDKHGDWIDLRRDDFTRLLAMSNSRKSPEKIFERRSWGLQTKRDAWCINASREILARNIRSTIGAYNGEVDKWLSRKEVEQENSVQLLEPDDTIDMDSKQISWSRALKGALRKGKYININDGKFAICMHRPFTKRWLYYSRDLNDMRSLIPNIFPDATLPNRVIAVTGKGSRSGFSALMIDRLPSDETLEKAQCFPFWLYDEGVSWEHALLEGLDDQEHQRREAVTDYSLDHFRSAYPGEPVSKEDIFHYIYGLLHSEDYRERFRANLAKELPFIPCVTSAEHFYAFRDAGHRLGELHMGYESVDPYSAEVDWGGTDATSIGMEAAYRVEKMRHPKIDGRDDLTRVMYNPHITIRGIPEEAYEYVVNGKSALKWVMARQQSQMKYDKGESGIFSDANRYAIETVGDPRYPLDLFLRVITVSLETMKIVKSLPKLQISN